MICNITLQRGKKPFSFVKKNQNPFFFILKAQSVTVKEIYSHEI